MLLYLMTTGLIIAAIAIGGYAVYHKILAPLAVIADDLKQAKFEHNIMDKLQTIQVNKGLSDHYNLHLENNFHANNYLAKLQQSLNQAGPHRDNLRISQPTNAILLQARLLQQQKKHIKYH